MIPGVLAQKTKRGQNYLQAISSRLPQTVSVGKAKALVALNIASPQSASTARLKAKGVPLLVAIGQAATSLHVKTKLFSLAAATNASLRKTARKTFALVQSQAIGTPLDPAAQFLARTSGLDSTHKTAYTTLINGLITDGVWSKLDVLYIFATQDSTTALLNLCSTSYSGISHGSPTFTTDRGFTGVESSNSVYIDSGFNPNTAGGKFATNSCHISAWSDTNAAGASTGSTLMGAVSGGGGNQTILIGRDNLGNVYFRVNDATASGGFTNASAVGHWIASRTGASTSTGYKNGSSFATPNAAAGTPVNGNLFILCYSSGGTPAGGTGNQLTMASIGGGLTATDATNFYNRLRTYMTTVGVP